MEKIGWFDRFLVGFRQHLVLSEGPEAMVVIFKDGEKYKAWGERPKGSLFICSRNSISRVNGIGEAQRSVDEIVAILAEDLPRNSCNFELT